VDNLNYNYICPAKVNFTLKIGRKNQNNLHTILSLIRKIAIYDKISFKFTDGFYKIKTVSGESISNQLSEEKKIEYDKFLNKNLSNENNIIIKCAKLFFDTVNVKNINLKNRGLDICIEKNIPIQAGLGGGSSDGAGMLTILNDVFKNPLNLNELKKIALKIGSDLPFFLTKKNAVVTGCGEILIDVEDDLLANYYIVLIVPDFGISTKDAYNVFDDYILTKKLNYYNIMSLDLNNYINEIIISFNGGFKPSYEDKEVKSINPENDFEAAVFEKYPILQDIAESMMLYKARFSLLCGSGSAIFGAFETKDAAINYFKNLGSFSFYKRIFLNYITTTI
jgi:4-diphosphocytidyl-2-C-methyl-D-erythritol kinase